MTKLQYKKPGQEQSTNKGKPQKIIDRFNDLQSSRRGFESYWQSLHDYFYVEGNDSNKSYYPGTELDFEKLYDTTSLEASDILASGFMNYLTPPASKWFKLRTKDPALQESKAVSTFLQDIEAEVYHLLNRSNFYYQIHPSYKSSGVYGTALLYAEEDFEDDARFYNMPITQCCIAEDGRGRIAEYYIEFEYTAYQAMTRFGEDALSEKQRRELTQRKQDKKYTYILFIGKRSFREFDKDNKENMPIEALWIDKAEKKIVDEGGYNEFPAFAHRFNKRSFIPWGFSPAMKALPMARMANTIAKTTLRTMMKHTDPPIAAPYKSFIMPFSGNPRAVNFYKKGAVDKSSIFEFGNFGNPEVGMGALEYYNQKVRTMMYNDVFLAFQQITKQMNNPEIYERINEKMTLLGPSVGRFMGEVLDPIIQRAIGILSRRGKLPEPPDEMRDDPRYEIEYVSLLAQAQKRSEMHGLMSALTTVGQMAEFAPETLDKIDTDKAVEQVWGITGASAHILRDDSEVAKIRQQRQQLQAKAQKAELAQQNAKTAETLSKAEANAADARKDKVSELL